MDLRSTQIKDTYGNLATIGTVAGTPTTGTLQNGQGSNITSLTIAGDVAATNVNATSLTGTLTGNVVATTLTGTLTGNVVATTLAGTLSTAAQTNITSLGTLTGLSVNGTTALQGAVTINESGADVDLRVEGDTDANLLFVDASTDRVGIGTNTPAFLLDVDGELGVNGDINLKGSFSRSIELLNGNSTSNMRFDFPELTTAVGHLTFYRSTNTTGDKQLQIYKGDGTATLQSILSADGNSYLNASTGNVGIGTTSPTAKLSVDGSAVFNEAGADVDFRVEGDTDANLLFVDASTDRVGIGTNAPDALLTVDGIASFGDGAVGTPSIANTGDLNTGLWFPADDTIAFSEGGGERMRINSSGQVLIGTTANTSECQFFVSSGTAGTRLGLTNFFSMTYGTLSSGQNLDVVFQLNDGQGYIAEVEAFGVRSATGAVAYASKKFFFYTTTNFASVSSVNVGVSGWASGDLTVAAVGSGAQYRFRIAYPTGTWAGGDIDTRQVLKITITTSLNTAKYISATIS